MNHPSFSVVMPTFQRRDVVCAAVEALGSMAYDGAVELIVVVDGSTDGTAEALRQVDCPFAMRIIEQPNRGASAARNRGAECAAHDIILFLDDDMFCQPDLVEQHARQYRDGADAVIGTIVMDQQSVPGFLSDSVRRWIESEPVRSPLTPWDIFSGQLSVKRAVFDAVGGFDETYTAHDAFANEDADLGVRLLAGFDVRHNPQAITRQRYVVTPREYMERAPKAVTGELHFLTKHPQFSREMLDARGMGTRLGRFAYLPLSRIPWIARLVRLSALWAAEVGLKTPLRSNRMLARYFSGSRSVAFWAELRARRQLPGRERLLVLCYHAIRDLSDDPVLAPYSVDEQQFAEQLDMLRKDGFTFVSPQVVVDYIDHAAPLPHRPVLLTFDDCYDDLLATAHNILKPRSIPALAFAVTAMKSATNEWDQPAGSARLKLLTASQMRELVALGIEIGSHSRTHRELPSLDEAEQSREAAGSADDLAAMGLPRPRFFAYPFGSADAEGQAAVARAGYVAAFGCRPDWIRSGHDRFDLPRVIVLASDRGRRFLLKARAPRLFEGLARFHRGLARRLPAIKRRADAAG
jgi:glycosyltransferase involved in cell wall biosynthesis/peptidoglycan/xylan/chitin deacetylase (PgdA/CDA1 family)